MTAERSYHLALRDFHAAAGAVFAPHQGWSLPAHYGDPAAEYRALRGAAAAFDVSHRSRFMVTGPDAVELLSRALAGDVAKLVEGKALRTAALTGDGRIDDLLLVARSGAIAYSLSGEAPRRFATLARLQAAAGDLDARVDDRTETTCLLAITGPAAGEAAGRQLAEALPQRMALLDVAAFQFHGFRGMATRTSDTGEDGFQLLLAPAVAQHVLELLSGAGVRLGGRAAAEAARVETGIPAWEPDLAPGLTPAEAELDVLLGLPGEPPARRLVALVSEGPPVPPGTPLRRDGSVVGEVRSCLRSPFLDATAALAILNHHSAAPGTALQLAGAPATVAAKPLYRRRLG